MSTDLPPHHRQPAPAGAGDHGGGFTGLPGDVDDEVIFLVDQPHQIG